MAALGQARPAGAEFGAGHIPGAQHTELGDVSVRTVETHRAHIHQKLNVKTRAEIVRVAREAGILEADETL